MKSKVLAIAALIMFSAGISALANEDPSNRLAVVPVKGSEVIKVIYKGENVTKVKLYVYNASSQLVFAETINGVDGFIRPLNFSGLKAGEYTIELLEGGVKRSEKIFYAPAKAATSSKAIHVSKINAEQGRFLVSIQNAGTETITVRILDRSNNELFSETREISGEFAQVYRVKDNAEVKFEIYDNSGLTKSSRF